ncbi:MAG: hypothetical protein RPV21_07950 [Candidatus Sedimenticola sp. (ex Thyasira tokunagai)]
MKGSDFAAGRRSAPGNDPGTELLRSELFSIEQLNRHGVKLVGRHKTDPRSGADRLLPRLADNEQVLLAAYDVVNATQLSAAAARTVATNQIFIANNTTLVFSTDSDLFKFLKGMTPDQTTIVGAQ